MPRFISCPPAFSIVRKAILLLMLAAFATASAAGKKRPAVPAPLPEKGLPIDDALSLDKLLDPGAPLPEILPAPESIPAAPKSPAKKPASAASAKAELVSAANDYRQKTALYRKGKISRDALKASAVRVVESAKVYRASLKR